MSPADCSAVLLVAVDPQHVETGLDQVVSSLPVLTVSAVSSRAGAGNGCVARAQQGARLMTAGSTSSMMAKNCPIGLGVQAPQECRVDAIKAFHHQA